VADLLRQGKPIQGSLELPECLVLWELVYEGGVLKFSARDYLALDEPIPFSLTEDGQGPPG
jgi:hypothetical protein